MTDASAQEQSLPASLANLSGAVLEERYELGEILGAGGMGAVFRAKHLRLDRMVAIKILPPVFSGHEQYVKRFLREAKAASKIRHRNVVEILDYGETADGLVYSVMEFLKGQDLDQLLRSQPENRLSWAVARELLIQTATGLKAAHGCGVVHRDIKPANCFLTDEDGDPLVKLVDFGIAKVEDGGETNQLTGTAQVLGTPSYIAPELVRTDAPAGPKSDIYSLGVLAYRMLAGTVPFSGGTTFEVLRRACFDEVPPIREHVPDVPHDVEKFVLAMLAKEPVDRPADMAEVRERALALAPDDNTTQLMGGSGAAAILVSSASSSSMTNPRPQPAPVTPATQMLQDSPATPVVAPASPATVVATPGAMPTPMPAHSGVASFEPQAKRGSPWPWLFGIAVLVIAAAIVVPQLLEGGADSNAGTVAAAPEPAKAEATPAEPKVAAPEPAPAEPVVEAEPAPEAAAAAEDEAEPTEGEPDDEVVIEDDEPEAEPVEAEPTPATPKPKKKAKKPAGPPPDAGVIKKLQRKIAGRCEKLLAGQRVKVKFFVMPDGTANHVSPSPSGPAGQCAKVVVQSARFRTRDKQTPTVLTVN
ncbi:MAG: protein kinase [Myxococcota bacterium]